MDKIKSRRIKFNRKLILIKPFIKSVISLLKFIRISVNFNDIMWNSWVASIIKELDNKGAAETIRLFKELQRIGIQISLGIPITTKPSRKVIKGTMNIPVLLKPLLPLLQGKPFDKRIGLTLLNLYKLLRLPPDDDYSAIVLPGIKVPEKLLEDFTTFIYGFPATSALVGSVELDQDKLHSSIGYIPVGNGPNGPSVKNAHKDFVALYRDKPLYEAVKLLLRKTNPLVSYSLEGFERLVTKDKYDMYDQTYIHSKISQLCEGGGKTRNIAIIDYFSQNALAALHDELMKKIRRIHNDATYSQEDGFQNVVKIANQEGCCYSFDLSSATDRLPLSIQKIVITKIFGKEIGELWSTVIAKRNFKTPQGNVVRWAVGQPLGALSSWITFSITHHLIIRFCAGTPYFNKYVILGDDVAIMSRQVAQKYVEVMGKLGVSINMNKGFVSENKPVFGEFAKRIFLGDIEITGLPVDLLLATRQSLYNIPDFLTFLKQRWKISIPGFELYSPEFFPFLSKKGKKLLSVILTFRSTMESGQAGFPWCILGADDLFTRVRTAYLKRFEDKISTFFELGSRERDRIIDKFLVKPIQENEGDHVSNMVLASIHERLHPISLLAIQIMARLSDAQFNLHENLRSLDKYLVEFIPDPQLRAYTYDRKTVRNATIGKAALEFYHEDLKKLQIH